MVVPTPAITYIIGTYIIFTKQIECKAINILFDNHIIFQVEIVHKFCLLSMFCHKKGEKQVEKKAVKIRTRTKEIGSHLFPIRQKRTQ